MFGFTSSIFQFSPDFVIFFLGEEKIYDIGALYTLLGTKRNPSLENIDLILVEVLATLIRIKKIFGSIFCAQ